LVLAFGAGDAAGEGLAAGLEVFAGVVVGVLPASIGEADADGDGLAVGGVFVLSPGAGSQPTANMIENVATSKRAVRLINLMFGFFIIFPSFQQD
jgi:hypothetical protein